MDLLRLFLTGCALSALTIPPAQAGASNLVGHSAHYTIRLSAVHDNSGIVGAQGETDYRFVDSCDGWVVENRSRIAFQYAQGGLTNSEWIFSAWESKDGRRFRFNVRQTRNGEVVEDLKGAVDRDKADGKGSALMNKPSDTEIMFPAGTMFPTQHTLAILKAADHGEGVFNRLLFDGSGLDNPFEVNALIGKVRPVGPLSITGGKAFDPARHWNVRLAFFNPKSQAPEPKFEMELKYRADGIATRILQDFDDFSLDAVLDKIEKLPKPEC